MKENGHTTHIIIRIIAAALILASALLSLSSCKGNLASIELSSPLTDEERVYYTGQDFDTPVDTANGTFSKIPNVYVIYEDGTRSEDVSHSDSVTFSGYDAGKAGEQVITVTYREGKYTIKTKYTVTVRERELCYIEADDTYHNIFPFEVGDRFVTSEITENGAKRGVTVTFRYNDPNCPTEAFFADDPALDGIAFDTTGCLLDENGAFTQAGTFTVQIMYCGLTATYKIRVIDPATEKEGGKIEE